jgi:predicted dehydrogenase
VSTLRTGVIGLGEVAQVIHLPVLQALPELYEVRSVCDISPTLVKVVGDRFGVPGRYTDPDEMLAGEELDCVLVLNSDEYHADCVTAALRRDLHVMVEKPMCLNVREAHDIIAARERSGTHVMVGYMRRFRARPSSRPSSRSPSWAASTTPGCTTIIGTTTSSWRRPPP